MTTAADIEEKAAAWLARRDADGDVAQFSEFNAWLADSPRHRSAYLRLAAAWERSLRLKRLKPEQAGIDPDLLAPEPRHRAMWLLPLSLAAAFVLAAAVIFLVPWRGTIYRTEIGGFSRVVLNDGSVLSLNTDTELRVDFTKKKREVELVRGEAQFNVAHDQTRPFEVRASGRLVRAVGTAFDVRLYHGEAMEVLVTDGRVALVDVALSSRAAGAEISPANISAGETAMATNKRVTLRRVSAAEAARRLAWQAGELSFKGETLAEAVSEFNRYARKKLLVDDPSIAALQIGGNFHTSDVDTFVTALNRSFGIIATIGGDGTVRLTHSPPSATPRN